MLQMLTVWCLDMTLQFDDKLYFVLLFSFLRDSFDMDVLMAGDLSSCLSLPRAGILGICPHVRLGMREELTCRNSKIIHILHFL